MISGRDIFPIQLTMIRACETTRTVAANIVVMSSIGNESILNKDDKLVVSIKISNRLSLLFLKYLLIFH
jgi:hypothetical protein